MAMNNMNPAAVRAAILVVELVTFLMVTAFLIYFISHAGAVQMADGDKPPAQFPVLVYEGDRQRPTPANYRILNWGEWERAAKPGASLLLPERAGRLRLGDSEAVFSASEERDARQDVELTWRSAGGEYQVRYVAEARSISPRYFRTVGTTTFLIGAAAGFVAGMMLGRVLRRRWIAQPGHLAPPSAQG